MSALSYSVSLRKLSRQHSSKSGHKMSYVSILDLCCLGNIKINYICDKCELGYINICLVHRIISSIKFNRFRHSYMYHHVFD